MRGRALFAVALWTGLSGAAAAQTPFSAAASPNPVVLQAGGPAAMVTVTTATFTDLRDPIVYAFSGFPAGITTGAAQTVNPPHAPVAFAFSAAAGVPPGTYGGILTGTTSSATTTVNFTVVVQQPAAQSPIIDAISPAALTAGTRETLVRIAGRHFQPGALITSPDPAVRVVRSRVFTPTSAEVVVAVRPDAPAGPYRLDMQNPGGAAAARATVNVYPTGSAAAPLAVTGIRIVSPLPWQIVADDEPVHAHALLATTGIGAVVGTWLLDGVPFERFTQIASGGRPIEVRSRMPIPLSFTGEHRLELVLESPRTAPQHHVPFLQSSERRSALRILAPDATGLLDLATPVFRWSLVPGASGYEVELRYRPRGPDDDTRWIVVRRRVAATRWRPEPELLDALADADAAFRVRAAFPGDVFGPPAAWREFSFRSREHPPDDPERSGRDPGGGPDGPVGIGSGAGSAGGYGDAASADIEPGPSAGWTMEPLSYRAMQSFPSARGGQLGLTVGSTTTGTRPVPAGAAGLTRLQLSTLADVHAGRIQQQVTGDFSASQDLGDPWGARAESRSWVARFGAPDGAVRPEATIGFAPPSFLDQTEFLTVFTPGGGVQGTLGSDVGRVSYFRTARLSDNGVVGPEPEIGAAAYELSTPDGRYQFRATAVHVNEKAIEDFSAGAEGTGLGFLASASLGTGLQLVGEVAFGDYKPGAGSLDEARDGRAFRVAARGGAGTFGYSVGASRSDEGFVNPANPGFTPSGVSGRTRADVSLSNTFLGRAAVSGTYNHVRGGVAHGYGDPRTTEDGASLSVSVPVTSRVVVALGGNLHGHRGAADAELELPGMHRTRKGVQLAVTETVGTISFSQAVGWQDFTDRNDPWADQRVFDVSLGAHGAIHRLIHVSASASETRIDDAPELGTTRHRLISVQPALTVLDSRLRLAPRVAFSRVTNDVQESEFSSAHYQVAARWTAPWTRLPVALEIASDWNRSWSGFDEIRPPFENRTLLTLSLNWQTDRTW